MQFLLVWPSMPGIPIPLRNKLATSLGRLTGFLKVDLKYSEVNQQYEVSKKVGRSMCGFFFSRRRGWGERGALNNGTLFMPKTFYL